MQNPIKEIENWKVGLNNAVDGLAIGIASVGSDKMSAKLDFVGNSSLKSFGMKAIAGALISAVVPQNRVTKIVESGVMADAGQDLTIYAINKISSLKSSS